MISKFVITVTTLLFLSGCNGNSSKNNESENQNIIHLKNYDYNINNNSYVLPQGRIIKNPYDISFSQNKKHIIYTSIANGDEPEVYILDKQTKLTKKITDNIYIESYPVINNEGTYAFILSEYSGSKSKIILNGETVKNTIGLYKNLAINEKYLIYTFENYTTDQHFLQWIDLESKKNNSIELPSYIQKIELVNTHNALIQYFSIESMSMDIGIINLKKKNLNKLKSTALDEIIKDVDYGKSYTLASIHATDIDTKLLFNTYYNYYVSQLSNPFSNSNNFMGRLTWSESYRLSNLVKLYNVTGNKKVYNQIDQVINNLLNGTNEKIIKPDKYNYPHSFSTKKYSLDKTTPISLMVSDAKIYVSIVEALNVIEGDLKTKYYDRIVNNISELYGNYEPYYDKYSSTYSFQHGIAFQFDGVWLPFNQQNVFASLLLEMYKLTKNDLYKKRVFSLAKKFKQSFIYTDNRLVWHYWPDMYYAGWDQSILSSINTPKQVESHDNLYEDLSHAGLNVLFILKFQQMFPNEVFSEDDINRLRNTTDNFLFDKKSSRFMSGDTEYQAANYRFIPSFGWSLLRNEKLSKLLIPLRPYFHTEFDQHIWGSYLDLIDTQALKLGSLHITREQFDLRHQLIQIQNQSYNYKNIINFFEFEIKD